MCVEITIVLLNEKIKEINLRKKKNLIEFKF